MDRVTETDGAAGEALPPRAPRALKGMDPGRIEDLDVREQLRRGGEPFERIMAAANGLPAGSVLRVRAIFEPQPLYAVMAGRGFEHWTEPLGEEDWRVWFWRQDSNEQRSEEKEMSARQGPYLLDVRELDGPEKHPTIHEMFDDLGPGQVLTIVNDHNPKPLFYELQAERPDSFDGENYRAYEAAERVWVAILPRLG